KIAAASAIVLFAAALPSSMAGWGVRDLTSVAALGAIGFPSSAALLVALLIGVFSLATNVLMAVVASFFNRPLAPMHPVARGPDGIAAFVGWAIPLAAATTVLFQLHVPTGGVFLNVNLADPIVIIGATLFLLRTVMRRPVWSMPHLALWIGLMTAVIVAGFLHGYASFGYSQWAAVNKTLGWSLLLCYGMTGALILDAGGEEARAVLLRTVIATAGAVIALEILSFAAGFVGGWHGRAFGFAGDPNAFAFQILIALCLAVSSGREGWRLRWFIPLALFGLWLTGSRSGAIALMAMFGALILLRRDVQPAIRIGAIAGIATMAALVIGHQIMTVVGNEEIGTPSLLSHLFRGERTLSTSDHLQTVLDGLAQFRAHPVFGAGLGYFFEDYARSHARAHNIDSTFVWLLADLGLVGFLVFASPFLALFFREFRKAWHGDRLATGIVLILVVFATFGLFYDLLYQRLFWFVLGAMLISSYRPAMMPQWSEARRPR
ncbi:MAG: O-antigen ligase family protein, partial [Pseudorhodoplanes sp.]